MNNQPRRRRQNRDRAGRFTETNTGITPPQAANTPPPCDPNDPYICESDHAPTVTAYAAFEKKLITTTEAAKIAGVTNSTMRRWIEDGNVKAIRIGKNGHWRINHAHLLEALDGIDPIAGPYGPYPIGMQID